MNTKHIAQCEYLINAIFDAVLILDNGGFIVDWNQVAKNLFVYSWEEIRDQSYKKLFIADINENISADIQQSINNKEIWTGELEIMTTNGAPVLTKSTLHPRFDVDNLFCGFIWIFHDLTKEKITKKIIDLRLKLWEFSSSHTTEKLMQNALDEICSITNSSIGFYHFVTEDQQNLTLQVWSTRTKKEFCRAEGKGMHYPISEAGVWVDCVHKRQPVIHNDYASLPGRKGMPNGHAEVIRELVVPTIINGRVVSILGVGNKTSHYDESDVELVMYIASIIWTIIEKKKSDEQILLFNKELKEKVAIRTTELDNQTKKSEEMNIALRVLYSQLDEDKAKQEAETLAKLEKLVLPLLRKLDNQFLDGPQKSIIKALNKNLEELASTLLRSPLVGLTKLTPSQVQIFSLIQHGHGTKEIASILNLSPLTISRHRQEIRKRLGLQNKKSSLRSYLNQTGDV